MRAQHTIVAAIAALLMASPANATVPEAALVGAGEHYRIAGSINGVDFLLSAIDGVIATESGNHSQYACVELWSSSYDESGCGVVQITANGDRFSVTGTVPTWLRTTQGRSRSSLTFSASANLFTSLGIPTGDITLRVDPVDIGVRLGVPNDPTVGPYGARLRPGNDYGQGSVSLSGDHFSGDFTNGRARRFAGATWHLLPSSEVGARQLQDAVRDNETELSTGMLEQLPLP